MKYLTRPLFYLVLLVSHTYAQKAVTPEQNERFYWAEMGFLTSKMKDAERMNTLCFAFQYSYKHTHFVKAGFFSSDKESTSTFTLQKDPNRNINVTSFYAQYGIGSNTTRKFYVALYAGLSYNLIQHRGEVSRTIYTPGGHGLFGPYPEKTEYFYNYETLRAIGLPLTFTIGLPAWRYLGFSMDFYGNISRYAFYGCSFNLMVGRIRNSG